MSLAAPPIRPASAFRLRAATTDDVARCREIYARAVETGTASFELTPPDLAEMTRRFEAVTGAGHPWLVAVLDGTVAGYAYAGPYRPRPAYRFTVEDSIYVDEAARGHGLGRALLAALVEDCEARGRRRMIAVIGDGANTASIGLHAALGFTHAGLLPSVGWKHGRWLDSVLMQRSLGSGDDEPPAG